MPLTLTQIFSEEELSFRLKSLSSDTDLDLDAVDYLKALTHRSYVVGDDSQPVEDNERLEFLGDSIANALVSEYLYNTYPNWDEGRLSQAKSILVSGAVYADCAKQLSLGKHLLLSKTEMMARAYDKESVLEDAFEAFMGCIYQLKGLQVCTQILKKTLFPRVKDHLSNPNLINGKSMLMEYLQKASLPLPEYRVIEEFGLEHQKTFVIRVFIANIPMAQGKGSSKKIVEKQVAMESYNMITENPEILKALL
jgi:ribonuclease III